MTGTVTDPAGAAVVGTQVTAISEATGETRTVASQQDGLYTIPLLLPGSYRVEFSKSGLYDATYGRNAGANVNVVTRSGGNEFHGTLFEFFRNHALNANEFFLNKAEQKKGVLKQNQFGFTLGGLVQKDKLLFFISYQGMRQVNGVGGGGTSSFFSPPFTDDRSRGVDGKARNGNPAAKRGGPISGCALAAASLGGNYED